MFLCNLDSISTQKKIGKSFADMLVIAGGFWVSPHETRTKNTPENRLLRRLARRRGWLPPIGTTLGRTNGELLKKTSENGRIMLAQIA